MECGGGGGHSMQGGQETTEDEKEQDGHDREPVEGQITPGGQDGGEEAGGGGLIGHDPGGADGEAEVGPRTRSKTKSLKTLKLFTIQNCIFKNPSKFSYFLKGPVPYYTGLVPKK